jgi:hypothetical protein
LADLEIRTQNSNKKHRLMSLTHPKNKLTLLIGTLLIQNFVVGGFTYGFDETLSDPHHGIELTMGQIEFSKTLNRQGYYAFAHKKSNAKNLPLILMNFGGPGMASLGLLVTGCGPYKMDLATGNLA